MVRRMIIPLGGRVLPGLALLVSLAAPAGAAVRADVDRDQVYVGDTVTLVIESNAPGGGEPDLSVLQEDFEIVGTGTSSRFSMVNGRSSSLRSWRVQLRPRRMGEIRIPILRLGSEQTEPLTISVSDVPALATTSGDAPALVESSIDAEGTVYVQQQVPVTVRLYQDQRVVDGVLEPLQLAGAMIEPLGLERRYTVTRNGRQYRVSESRYAVAAERRGTLQIPALDFRGKLAPVSPGSGGMQPFRVSSEPLTLDVQPPAIDGEYWLPAQQLTVHDNWSDRAPTLRRGEPVERVITLQAQGLSGSQLPILQPKTPPGVRIYPGRQVNDTRSDHNTLYGISRQTFTYVPGEDGELSIPSIAVNWWNTGAQRQETATVAAVMLQVTSGAAGSDTADQQAVEGRPGVGVSGGEVGESLPWWLWVLMGVGALLAVFGLRHRSVGRGVERVRRIPMPQRVESRPRAPDPMPDEGPAARPTPTARRPDAVGIAQHIEQLESACRRQDAQAAGAALLALGRARWPDAPPTNLRDLADCLPQGQTEINALDRILYGSAQPSWNGAALWAAIGTLSWQADTTPARHPDDSPVPPLYPQGA